MRPLWQRAFLTAIFALTLCAAHAQEPAPKPTPLNAPPQLRVTLPWGLVVTYPAEILWAGPCISTTQFGNLLKALDPKAEINWDAATGVLTAMVKKHNLSLFIRENTLVFDKKALDIDHRLIEARGQIYLSLAVLDDILSHFDHIETNIPTLLDLYGQNKTELPSDETPPKTLQDPGPQGVTPINTNALRELLEIWSGEKNITLARIESDLRLAAAPLADRRTIVIDPRRLVITDNMRAGGVTSDPPDISLAVAKRCRDLLADSPAVQIVLTREDEKEPDSRQRVETINTSGAKALIAIELDWSRFDNISGYGLYTVHQAVDPQSLKRADDPARMRLERAYLPYQHMSLALTRLVETELARTGNRPARTPIRLTPRYILKRSAMPSTALNLGFWSNTEDRQRMQNDNYVETMATALAQALLRYSRQLERIRTDEGMSL